MRPSVAAALLLMLLFPSKPAAGLDYDPYDVAFDAAGFDPRGARPGSVAVPAARRVTFRFNATSAAPCAQVKSAISIFTGGSIFRTVYLGESDGESVVVVRAPSGAAFRVIARAYVRVPSDGGLPSGQRLWAVADGPIVHEGAVP